MEQSLMRAAEKLHEIVWRKFIRMPYGHVLDYAPREGAAGNLYPTPEQCENDFPNPMGWWTPVENGAFFTGLYAAALTEKYRRQPDEKTKSELLTLANGLFLLQDISEVDGFIARGVGTDGKSHYKLSSEDQVGPWVYGLWRVLDSGAADEALCDGIRRRLLREVGGLEKRGFAIPTEWGEHVWGSFAGSDFRGCAKLLGCVRAAYAASGDDAWRVLYEKLSAEKPDGIYTRREICANGLAPDMVRNNGLIQFWIFACSSEFLYALAESDTGAADAYRRGLSGSAATAVKFLEDYKKFAALPRQGFDIDWTGLSDLWRVPADPMDGMNMALEQNRVWMEKLVPERKAEHNILGNALFACLICARAPEKAVRDYAARTLSELIGAVDWEALNLSYAFVAESACLLLGGK